MPPRRIRHPVRYPLPAALVFACLLLGGCKGQHEPAKPIVDLPDRVAVAA